MIHRCLFYLALVAMTGASKVWAASCPNAQWSITGSTPALIPVSSAAGTLYTGALTFDSGLCTIGVQTGTNNEYVAAHPSWQGASGALATAAPGIRIVSNGSPTASIIQNSGTCTLNFGPWKSQYDPQVILDNTSTTSTATCRYRVSFPFAFTKLAGAASGTLPLTQLLATAGPTTNTTAWGTWGDGVVANRASGNPGWSPTFGSVSCSVTTSNVTVNLPNVARTSLATAGATAGTTPFTLQLSGCTDPGLAYAALATWTFTQGPINTTLSNTASSPAANVHVQLLDANLSPIANGSTTTLASVSGGGAYSVTYYARYRSNGVAGAGAVKGSATFTLSYQ